MHEARESMRFLLEETQPQADIDAVARDWITSTEWYDALKWHPNVSTRQRVQGEERVRALVGRGMVLSFAHLGQYDGLFGSLARVGVPCTVVAASHMLAPDAPKVRQQHLRVVSAGGHVVSNDSGFAGLVQLVRNGATVALASDVAGRTPVTFAGREVLGSFGAPRLAFETDSPVVLCTAHPTPGRRWCPRLRLHEPLYPRDFATPHSLLDEINRRHEEAILAWPTGYERPLVRWGKTAN